MLYLKLDKSYVSDLNERLIKQIIFKNNEDKEFEGWLWKLKSNNILLLNINNIHKILI